MYKPSYLVVVLSLFSFPVVSGVLDDFGKKIVQDIVKEAISEPKLTEDLKSSTENKSLDKLDASESDLWSEVRFQWGKYATSDNVSFIKHDVTCDGHTDYVAYRLNQDNPDGLFFDVLVVTLDSGEVASYGRSLAFDDSQSGLCKPIENPVVTVEIEHWDEGQLDAELGSWEGICTEAIRVDDGMCDSIRYFWLKGNDDTKLMFYRN